MTVAEKFAVAIDVQQREVDRLTAVATVDLPAARAVLNQLQTLAAKITPALETAVAALKAAGIALDS